MDYIVQKTQRKLKLKKKDAPIPISVKSIHKQKLKYLLNLILILKSAQQIR